VVPYGRMHCGSYAVRAAKVRVVRRLPCLPYGAGFPLHVMTYSLRHVFGEHLVAFIQFQCRYNPLSKINRMIEKPKLSERCNYIPAL